MKHRNIPVVWTNDDVHYGRSRELRRQLRFLDRFGIPGVFFLIPRTEQGDLDEDEELLAVIAEAKARGHEFYQHGYIHTAFECGIPELSMLEHHQPTRRFFDEHRDQVESGHTLEAQAEMVANGDGIWRRAFGEPSRGFRPGWGAFCGNLYKALAMAGFEWVSSRIPCFTSWDRNRGEWEAPVHFRETLPTSPYRHPEGILEIPMAGDYAFRVPNVPARMESMVKLACEEFAVYRKRGDPMLIVSHCHGLEYRGDAGGAPPHPTGTGYAIHETLLTMLMETGEAAFMGMNELLNLYHHRNACRDACSGGEMNNGQPRTNQKHREKV
ncbi:MAG TPA: DUF2334 domain-containing protein [Chthoniobacteraceae bacterium]|nr:DUF2334 domain-containing protein [Chthoniobacteraceae bacterium]